MKTILSTFLLVLASVVHAAEFHVAPAPAGNDANPGTAAAPFATLEKARDAARGARVEGRGGRGEGRGSNTIILAKGLYRLSKTLELDGRDSGTLFKGQPGASIVGSVAIPNTAVKPVTDPAILNRLLPEVRDKVLEIDLHALGITDFGDIGPRGFRRPYIPAPLELIMDGEPLDIARWPDAGQPGEPMGKVTSRGSITRKGDKPTRGGVFRFKTDRPSRWAQADDVWITGLFANGYADNTVKVKTFDLAKKTLTTVQPHMYGFQSGSPWNRWTALNLLEEISVPGEYMADQTTGKLFFLPTTDFQVARDLRARADAARRSAPTSGCLEVTVLRFPLLALEGATNVVFDGVNFENSRGMGVYIERGANCRIQNATLRNLGMVAVCIGKGVSPDPNYRHAFTGTPVSRELGSWHEHLYNNTAFNREAGTGHGIVNCTIYNIGEGAISLGGGDRKSLTPGGNYVENCDIHHFNRWDRTYRSAVNIDGVGNRISHCDIHDCPGSAIYLHGNDHLIEFNTVHHALLEGNEMGAFYMGRDPSERGTILRYNFFHHIGSWDKPELKGHGSVALHFDDGCGNGTAVYGNIFWRPGSCGALILGDEITVTNNLFIDCHSIQDVFVGFPYDRRLVTQRLNAVGFDQSPWKEHYPGFDSFLKNLSSHKRESLFAGNLLVNCPLWVRAKKRGKPDCVRRDNNRTITSTEAAALFMDPANGNFTLTPGAKSGIPGFQPIPFHQIHEHIRIENNRFTGQAIGNKPQAPCPYIVAREVKGLTVTGNRFEKDPKDSVRLERCEDVKAENNIGH